MSSCFKYYVYIQPFYVFTHFKQQTSTFKVVPGLWSNRDVNKVVVVFTYTLKIFYVQKIFNQN